MRSHRRREPRWRLGRRTRMARVERALETWRQDFHRERAELFAALPALTLASYLHAVAMWGQDADRVLEAITFPAPDDLDALRLVAFRSGLVERTTSGSTALTGLTRRGLAVLAALDGAPATAVRPAAGEACDG